MDCDIGGVEGLTYTLTLREHRAVLPQKVNNFCGDSQTPYRSDNKSQSVCCQLHDDRIEILVQFGKDTCRFSRIAEAGVNRVIPVVVGHCNVPLHFYSVHIKL